MARDWNHKVSVEWLAARNKYLTASEIVSLIPAYKRVKAKKLKPWEDSQFAKVYGKKLIKDEQSLDIESRGAMARGHILEPYAIDEANRFLDTKLYHWDDCIIHNGELGFSPDALDITQHSAAEGKVDIQGVDVMAKCIGEVKSYDAGTYWQRMAAKKPELPERWQIACGFAVLPTVAEGDLILYAPQTGTMSIVSYSPEDLADEMNAVHEIAGMWQRACAYYKEHIELLSTEYTEEKIHEEFVVTELLSN